MASEKWDKIGLALQSGRSPEWVKIRRTQREEAWASTHPTEVHPASHGMHPSSKTTTMHPASKAATTAVKGKRRRSNGKRHSKRTAVRHFVSLWVIQVLHC